jgi:hypothetical protein
MGGLKKRKKLLEAIILNDIKMYLKNLDLNGVE